MPNTNTKEKAIEALEGMRQIVKKEMFVRGEYVTDKIKNKKLAEEGALCQGRKYCAIGSLWVGGGVKLDVQEDEWTDYVGETRRNVSVTLPGTEQWGGQRESFLKNRPGLKLAYRKLNEAAREFADKNGLSSRIDNSQFDAEIEALFEGTTNKKVGRAELLKIITAAKRKVNAA